MEENTQKPIPINPEQMPQSHTQGPVKKSRRWLVIAILVVALVLVFAGGIIGYRYYRHQQTIKQAEQDKLKKQLLEQNQLMPPEIKLQKAIPAS